MARILIGTFPAVGHVNPFFPLVKALVTRGHEIVWLNGRIHQQKVEATGATFMPFVHAFDFNDINADERDASRMKSGGLKGLKADIKQIFLSNAPAQMRDTDDVARTFKPDIVMVDPCFVGGAWWAEQHHVPYVHFGVLPMGLTSVDTAPFGLGILPLDSALGRLRNRALNWLVQHVLFADVQKYWNQLRVSVGMPTTGWFHDTAAKAHLFLQLASPGFEYPRRDLMPQAHFIGAMPVHRPANWQEPTWAATAVDPNGGIHLAMFVSDERHSDNPLGSPALYSYCAGPATACADPNKWSNWLSFSSQVSDVQIAITHDGHPRLLVTRCSFARRSTDDAGRNRTIAPTYRHRFNRMGGKDSGR